jgi:hypothetical protein
MAINRERLVVELNRSLRDVDSQMHRRTINKAKVNCA